MSYIHKPHVQPLEHRTPFQLVRAHAKTHPHKEAFVFRDTTLHRVPVTFQEYASKSQALAAGLLQMGLSKGHRVSLMVPACPESVFIHMALNSIGAIVIVEGDFNIMKDIKNLACVISTTDNSVPQGQQVLHEIHSALQQQENLKAVLIGSGPVDLLQHSRVYKYDDLLEMAEKNPDSQEMVRKAEDKVLMDDPFLIMFTSGSTAAPKPIQYTNHGYVNGGIKDAISMNITPQSRQFNDSPLDWMPCMGVGISTVIALGCTLVLFPPKVGLKGGFTSTIMQTMAQEACTHCFVLPYFLHDLALRDVRGMDLSKLKYCATGGQPLNIPLVKKLLTILPEANIVNLYGSTETNVLGSQEVHKDIDIDAIVLGVMAICPGYEMKVVDQDGQIVPIGEQGELCTRAAWVSFPNPDMTWSSKEPANTRNSNWHHLGDRCSFNHQGQLKLYSRMDNIIKCATEKIQPLEVEELLYQHPDVEKVCVVGVPDQRLYEKICACIIMKSGKLGDQAAFDKWAEDKCAEMSIGMKEKPHYYLFADSFPLTRTGKLSRRLTKQWAIKTLELC